MSSSRQRVVFVGDEATVPRELERAFDVLSVSDGSSAVERLETTPVDCVVVDGSTVDRIETVDAARSAAPSIPIIYTSPTPDGAVAAAATRAGATEYFAGTTTQTITDRVNALLDETDGQTDSPVNRSEPNGAIDGGSDAGGRPASLEHAVERMDEAVVTVDDAWKVTYLNDSARELLDPAADPLGVTFWNAFPDEIAASQEAQYRRAMSDGESVSFETDVPPLDAWFRVRVTPTDDGLSLSVTDITDRKLREAELRRYETIVETIDDGVLVIDSGQEFVQVNETYADLLGYDRETLLGSHASIVVDESTWLEWMDVAISLASNETNHATMEAELNRADGTTVPIEATITVLETDDADDVAFVCIVRDLTKQNRREEVVTRLLETTRRLFACESRQAVAETTVNATIRAFGFPLVSVRLYDSDDEMLTLAAASEPVEERLGDRNPIPVGCGPIGTAFERSEPVLVDDVLRDDEFEYVHEYEPDSLRSVMCIPIGDLGVLSVGYPESGAFDESDRQLAELLTESAAVALERADRRETLVRHEQVLESVEGMVYAMDADGRFTLVTEPLAERLGYDRESLIGTHVSHVLDAESLRRGHQHVRDLLADSDRDSTTFEATATTATGERFPAEVECSLLPSDGGYRGTVGAVRDITQRKEREQYLQVLNRVLRHNLRNDLTVVIGYAELLLEEIDDETLSSSTETLYRTATDLARTSEKARAIQYALDREGEPEPIDVATLVRATVGGIEVGDAEVILSASSPCWARADDGLALVVENLVENAVRHAGSEPTVEISVTETGDEVQLAVADDGPGIPDSEIDVVTGDSDITQLTHSSGLGLWLVRWIVDSYDGSIRFDEGPLGGSEVTVALPRESPADPAEATERTLEAADVEPSQLDR